MLRETFSIEEQDAGVEEEMDGDLAADPQLERRLLRAVERYKAACAAAGEEPNASDAWLVFLSALRVEGDK